MPTSRKGSTRKKVRKVEYRPLPISLRLAAMLRQRANGSTANEPMLDKVWKVAPRFRTVIERLGLDPELTPYCLRYSSIARQLVRNIPIRICASNHDTSSIVIERFYTRHLAKAKQSDALTRATLLDLYQPPTSNVTPIRAA